MNRSFADSVFELPNAQGGEQQGFGAGEATGGGQLRFRTGGNSVIFRARPAFTRLWFADAAGGGA